MASITPLKHGTATLKAKTKNMNGRTAKFRVEWLEDHGEWKGKLDSTGSYVDERGIAGKDTATAKVSGDKAETPWDVTWPRISNQAKEIYAVIRAEFRFVKKNGWIKLAGKKSSQGMDSLFKKGSGNNTVYAICESKCTADLPAYAVWITGGSPLGKLGHPKGSDVAGRPLSKDGVTQMSPPWRTHAYAQELRGNPDPKVIDNLKAMKKWETDRNRTPLLWLNVYATDPFYLLPGVYSVKVRVAIKKKQKATAGNLIADWSDEKFRDYEFFALDDRTAKRPNITGAFYDYSVEFDTLCQLDAPNTQRVNAAKKAIEKRLNP